MIKTVASRRPPVKARSKELLDLALAATVAAIEIYNKPDFPYREETFAVLAINGWELLFKAKWLADHGNKVGSLYVLEERLKLDGSKSKKFRVKVTRSGNPFTHSLDYIAKRLIESKDFDVKGWANLEALLEMRDSSIHFYKPLIRGPGALFPGRDLHGHVPFSRELSAGSR
jgi:hypothetical protein